MESQVSIHRPGSALPQPPRVIDLMIDAAVRNLLRQQEGDGHWCAELEGDTILESEYVLLHHFLGRGDDPRVAACCQRLRSQQQEGGGWATYPDGPTDPSISVKAYLCLKLAGDEPVRRGTEFLLREQEKDGSWSGRWGANHIYGTWLALTALRLRYHGYAQYFPLEALAAYRRLEVSARNGGPTGNDLTAN